MNWDNHRYTTMTEAEFLELCSQDGIKTMSDADLIRRNYDIKLTDYHQGLDQRLPESHTDCPDPDALYEEQFETEQTIETIEPQQEEE